MEIPLEKLENPLETYNLGWKFKFGFYNDFSGRNKEFSRKRGVL